MSTSDALADADRDDAPLTLDPERKRLAEDARRTKNWKRWGPYLSGRQWGTVREDDRDDARDGRFWDAFPYEHSLGRAYRWGEDGLLGITDRECRLCFSIALWNGVDPHLKERLFGLNGIEGNHGEDVKEAYFHLDASPTHAYLRALYKYPQREFPYERLREESRRRGREGPEFELNDTGVFDDDRYWDVTVEYAKASPDDVLVRITVANRGPERARLHLLPTLWFRNTWTWESTSDEGKWPRPSMRADGDRAVVAEHVTLGKIRMVAGDADDGTRPSAWLFTENETSEALLGERAAHRVEGAPARYTKDGFHAHVVDGHREAVKHDGGTKSACIYVLDVAPGEERVVCLRMTPEGEVSDDPLGDGFGRVFDERRAEVDQFYDTVIDSRLSNEEKRICRQAYAGLLWSEQFEHYVMHDWLPGDPRHPLPEEVQAQRVNREWRHFFCRDVLSVPDTWEYPGFFGWDLAFHMVPLARIDPHFAKEQLLLLLREWYLDPGGQIPGSEYDLSAVTPPVHAWACWQVFKRSGGDDYVFLERVFLKLLMNFTWWVNRKDPSGRGVFAGGMLGMDNIGVFDRSRPLPDGSTLRQADGTAWMGFYCTTMLTMAVELAQHNPAYEDAASKFLEHFFLIADALNHMTGHGLWDDEDGFYYDQIAGKDDRSTPLKVRSMVGIIPLLGVYKLVEKLNLEKLPAFSARFQWFIEHRAEYMPHIGQIVHHGEPGSREALLALPSRERLERALRRLLDEDEFLSPFGVRSLSKYHRDHPYSVQLEGEEQPRVVRYEPGDMADGEIGGNSNWRGPVWFPVNYLLIEALDGYHEFFGDELRVECPTGSGTRMTLGEVADELRRRLITLFLPQDGRPRPCHGSLERFADDPHWRDHLLFHEYFNGDTGRGLGASHQTGWTALIACLIEEQR